MRRFPLIFCLSSCLALCATPVSAQSVSWAAKCPNSPGAGSIFGQGKADPGQGGVLNAVELIATAATDKKGGPGGEKRCDICGTTFTGTIANLATGTYNAFARMIFQDNAMKTRYWDSPQVSLTVK